MRVAQRTRIATMPESPCPTARELLPRVLARSLSGDAEAVRRSVGERLSLSPEDSVLELGCGDGRLLLELLARTPRGFVAGVEPFELMVRHATARTRHFIDGGRLKLINGSSSDLSLFPDEGFDKACGVDVVYFWERPERDLREIHRVLRPGGRLVLGYAPSAESCRGADPDIVRSVEEIEDWMRAVGFADVKSVTCHRGAGRGVMSWTHATKPSRPVGNGEAS